MIWVHINFDKLLYYKIRKFKDFIIIAIITFHAVCCALVQPLNLAENDNLCSQLPKEKQVQYNYYPIQDGS